MQQFVGNDRVEHAHAAFVEDAHDELLVLELLRESASPIFAAAAGTFTFFERP